MNKFFKSLKQQLSQNTSSEKVALERKKMEFYFMTFEHCEGVLQYATVILSPDIGNLWWLR